MTICYFGVGNKCGYYANIPCNQIYSLRETLKLALLIFDESLLAIWKATFSRVINAELPKFDAAIEHFVPKPG